MESKNNNISKKREEQNTMNEAMIKRDTLGSFSLTAQDHRDLRGTPDERLIGENEGKAEYEIMSDKEIEQSLDEAVENMNHPSSMGEILKNKLRLAIPFLRKVGKLPEKYRDFDINNL